MDTLLVNGDICINQSGEYDFVRGVAEVLQKVIISAKIRKGSFIYNKSLGTEIRDIDPEASNACESASLLLNEAIIEDIGYKAVVENMKKTEKGTWVLISVSDGKETRKAEVKISADL